MLGKKEKKGKGKEEKKRRKGGNDWGQNRYLEKSTPDLLLFLCKFFFFLFDLNIHPTSFFAILAKSSGNLKDIGPLGFLSI